MFFEQQSPSRVVAAASPPAMQAQRPSWQIPEMHEAPTEHAEPAGCGAGHVPSTQVPTQQSESLLQLPWSRQHVSVRRLQTDPVQYESDSQ